MSKRLNTRHIYTSDSANEGEEETNKKTKINKIDTEASNRDHEIYSFFPRNASVNERRFYFRPNIRCATLAVLCCVVFYFWGDFAYVFFYFSQNCSA